MGDPGSPVPVPAAGPEVDLSAADRIIRRHVLAAMALGAVPVPIVDVVGVIAVQRKLIFDLTRLYRVRFVDNLAKTLVTTLIGGAAPVTATAGLASVVKGLPGVGSLVGGAGVAVVAGALTYAVGTLFVKHFESQGTLLDVDPHKMRAAFRAEFARGRRAARALQRAGAADRPTGASPRPSK